MLCFAFCCRGRWCVFVVSASVFCLGEFGTGQNGAGIRKLCNFSYFHLPKRRRNMRIVQLFIIPLAKTALEHENGAIFHTFTCHSGAGTREKFHFWYSHLPNRRLNTRVLIFLVLSLAREAPEHESSSIFQYLHWPKRRRNTRLVHSLGLKSLFSGSS